MIKIFSQYSYGGFKTLYIEGVNSESLGPESEVTFANNHGFPPNAHLFFQFGGSKMAYLKLDSGEFALVVREIPSNDVDGAGRAISCAVQFIGQEEDKLTLDNLALVIANDVVAFGTFFADLFYVRQGLHIEGNKLRNFINQWASMVTIEGGIHPVLRSMDEKPQGIFLFVPLSEKFGTDREVTNRICEELKLKKNELKGSVISMKELNQLQKNLKITPQTQEVINIQEGYYEVVKNPVGDVKNEQKDKKPTENEVVTTSNDRAVQLEREVLQLKKQIDDEERNRQQTNESFRKYQELQELLKKKIEECESLSNQLSFYKKTVYALAFISAVLALAFFISCSH